MTLRFVRAHNYKTGDGFPLEERRTYCYIEILQNCIHEEIKSILGLGNACYYY